MIKSIVVDLDGSTASLAALTEAVKWAELLNAELRAVFVEDEQRFMYYPVGTAVEDEVPVPVLLPDDEAAGIKATVDQEADSIRAEFDRLTAGKTFPSSYSQIRGSVNEILTEEARAADLTVIGRRGRDSGAGTEPGPTTETLIHDALRPVLVVPEAPHTEGETVFAYDGSKGVQRVMVPGTELAHARGGDVVAITIGDDAAYAAQLDRVLTRYWQPYDVNGRCEFVEEKGKIVDIIATYTSDNKAGLLVMGAFGHNPIRELLFGSTTLDVLAKVSCPVLLMA